MDTASVLNPSMVAGAGLEPMDYELNVGANAQAAHAEGDVDARSSVSSVRLEPTTSDALAEKVRVLEKKVLELMQEKQDMDNQLQLKNKLISSMAEEKEKMKDKTFGPSEMKGFDVTSMKQPSEWNGKKEDFIMWNVLFKAYLGAADRKWKKILTDIQLLDKDVKFGEEMEREFFVGQGLSGEKVAISDLKQILFITLIQFTSDELKAKVYAEGEDNVLKTYKSMCWKGQDFDAKEIVELRSKVLNPERAKEVKDVEKKMAKWKEDAMRLDKVRPGALSSDDWVQPLWTIMPEVIQDHLIYRGITSEDGKKFEDVESAVEAFLRRWKQKNDKGSEKQVNVVLDEGSQSNGELLGSLNWQWCDIYGSYVAVKPLHAAVKRARTEEDDPVPVPMNDRAADQSSWWKSISGERRKGER